MFRFNRLSTQSVSRATGRYFSAEGAAKNAPKAAVASAASASQHAPPKKIHGRTGRYAMAAYTAASKVNHFSCLEFVWLCFFVISYLSNQVNMLEKVESELKALQDIVSKTPKFEQFLENPTVPRAEKTAKVSFSTYFCNFSLLASPSLLDELITG
jgi:hypothetical protein